MSIIIDNRKWLSAEEAVRLLVDGGYSPEEAIALLERFKRAHPEACKFKH